MTGSVWSVVVAGGSGTRFGGRKQFAALGGRSLAAWSVATARSACDGVVLVVPADAPAAGQGAGRSPGTGADVPDTGADVVVHGGATRADSVRAGLAAVPAAAEVVVVHDAARPLATPALFRAVVDAVRLPGGPAGAIPGVPVHDTVKRVAGGLVEATVDRRDLVAVQTPQAFRADALRRAHAGGADATDDAGLVESIGLDVAVVEGDPCNLKVTTPEDLVVVVALLAHRAGGDPGRGAGPADGPGQAGARVGSGTGAVPEPGGRR